MTGIDYQSGPHRYKGKWKATNTDSTTPTKLKKTDASPSPAPSTLGETPSKKSTAKGTARKTEIDHPLTALLQAGEITSEDTFSSSSSDTLPEVPFK